MTYFLWSGIFIANTSVFGYSQNQMLTYVFMVLIVQTMVLSAPSSDNIGGEIGNGDLSNYLVKPVSYLKYWFTRDVASKTLNFIFAVFEIILLWFLFRPVIIFPTNFAVILGFLVSLLLATVIYYLLSACARFVSFWAPENTWGLAFLVLVMIEILAGGIFPLNILPASIYQLLQLTPFPYLVFFPISIFSGKIIGLEIIKVLLQSAVYVAIMVWFTKFLWKKGMMVYQSSGK
ncbi:MAG: ABC-2 family transporter protein [Patescibacteria group bacterium]